MKIEVVENWEDPKWRLNNLYTCITDQGKKIPFRMNTAQETLFDNLWFFNLVLKARQLGFCLDPETRVLTADLQWSKIKDLRVGQKLVSVDENVPGGRGRARKMKVGTVQGVVSVFRQAYRITFDDGRSVVCTGKHPWLSRKKLKDPTWRKIEADDKRAALKVGTQIRWITKPWGDGLYEDGWFGGILDGEGSISKKNVAAGINASQRDGETWDRMVAYASNRSYNYRVEIDNRKSGDNSKLGTKTVNKICFGRMDEMFRLIGQTRPSRFVNSEFWVGRELPGKRVNGVGWATITKIEKLEEQEMIDLQVDAKTYIAEGFVSHNTTFIDIMGLDSVLFNEDYMVGICAHTREDVEKIFDKKIKTPYEDLPLGLQQARRADTDSAKKLKFNNGSSIEVGTSLRSGTYQFVHVSEFGKICAKFPDKAKEIVTGTFETVHPGSILLVESTAEGRSGYFYKYVMEAQKRQQQGKKLNKLQFKLHFFPWYLEKRNVLDPDTVTITSDHCAYFDRLENELNISLSQEQRAWYVTKEASLLDDMKREHPSTVEEAFEAAVSGAYLTKQMAFLRQNKRIGIVPHDPGHPVNTGWDFGLNDRMCIWLHQYVGMQHRLIGYMSGTDDDVLYYWRELQRLPYLWGEHFLPHDAGARRIGTAKSADENPRTLEQILMDAGMRNTRVIPRVDDKYTAIQETRLWLPKVWIDEKECSDGIVCLDNFKREFDDRIGDWKKKPLHDEAMHGYDALETLARGFTEKTIGNRQTRRRRRSAMTA